MGLLLSAPDLFPTLQGSDEILFILYTWREGVSYTEYLLGTRQCCLGVSNGILFRLQFCNEAKPRPSPGFLLDTCMPCTNLCPLRGVFGGQCLTATLGSSQPPATPLPRGLMPSPVLARYCIHMVHIHIPRDTYIRSIINT